MSTENENFQNEDFIDISSSTKKEPEKNIKKYVEKVGEYAEKAGGYVEKAGEYTEKYGNGVFKNLGTIIKFIAFVICFAIIILSFVAGYFVFSFNAFFATIAVGIIVVGTIFAVIMLFIIYAIGHVVCQNNEILTRLNKK